MEVSEVPTPEERTTAELVKALRETGNLRPLVTVLRDGDTGPERARDALLLLGEFDLELLVQVTLDTLIDGYVEDPGLAHQTRREIRGSDAGAATLLTALRRRRRHGAGGEVRAALVEAVPRRRLRRMSAGRW